MSTVGVRSLLVFCCLISLNKANNNTTNDEAQTIFWVETLEKVPPILVYSLELAVLAFFVYCLRYKLTLKPSASAYELTAPKDSGVVKSRQF